MKRLLIILALSTLTGVVACDTKDKCDCSRDNVCLTIINSTGQLVKSIKLIHEKGKVVSGQLARDGKTCLAFKSAGENSFRLTAILSNGDTVMSTAVYSEGGYKFIGIVTKDKIKIEPHIYD